MLEVRVLTRQHGLHHVWPMLPGVNNTWYTRHMPTRQGAGRREQTDTRTSTEAWAYKKKDKSFNVTQHPLCGRQRKGACTHSHDHQLLHARLHIPTATVTNGGRWTRQGEPWMSHSVSVRGMLIDHLFVRRAAAIHSSLAGGTPHPLRLFLTSYSENKKVEAE